ncbi:MAG: O-antigen ligase family protein [Betaproteobacteria bacterium]
MFLFVAWFWLTSFWALEETKHFDAAILHSKYLLVFWMIYRLVDTPSKVTAFLWAHVLGCFFLGILCYMAQYSGRLDGVGGPGIDDSNTLGMHLATGVVTGAMLLLRTSGWRWFFLVAAIAFTLNGMIMTSSRGAFLALLFGGASLLLFRAPVYKRKFAVYAVLAVVLVSVVAAQNFWERMSTVRAAVSMTEDAMDVSMESRIEMLKAQAQMAWQHPLGSGHRGSEVMSKFYLDPIYLTAEGARSSHNVFMTVLVEQGVPGVILFFALVFWVASTLLRLRSKAIREDDALLMIHAGAIAGVLAVVFVGGLFADFAKVEVQIWMIALLAVISQAQRAGVVTAARETVGVPSQSMPPGARAWPR